MPLTLNVYDAEIRSSQALYVFGFALHLMNYCFLRFVPDITAGVELWGEKEGNSWVVVLLAAGSQFVFGPRYKEWRVVMDAKGCEFGWTW
jgi:hypothetical protein